MKKIYAFLLCVLLSLSVFPINVVNGQEYEYRVYSLNEEIDESFNSYKEAIEFYDDKIDETLNLLLAKQGKIIKMEYGLVEFIDECVDYYSEIRDCHDYLDSRFFDVAAYLYTKDDYVYFKIASEIGSIKLDKVNLIPYEIDKTIFSNYSTKNNNLYHNIKTNINNNYYSYMVLVNEMPDGLKDNSEYYSFDNHFYYDSFYLMINDYLNNTNENAVNETAYYNYYQYVSEHTLTNYTKQEVEDYLYKILCIDGKILEYRDTNNDGANDVVNRSMIYDAVDGFFSYQNMYGVNALMALSSSIVDTSLGKSIVSYKHNSLFNNLVYDSEEELNNDKYTSVKNSVYAHNKYIINKLYSNYYKEYYGTHFGDKLSGITIEYSLDPYYGEKCASEYYKLDSALGLKDKDNFSYGIIVDEKVEFYKNEDLSSRQYHKDVDELALTILDENDISYLVQVDFVNGSDCLYDYTNQMYVDKNIFKYIYNIENIHNYDFDNLILDTEINETIDDYSINIIEDNYEFDEIREKDLEKLVNSINGYHINDNSLDMSISGLTTGLQEPLFNLVFGNTYYVEVNENIKLNDSFKKMVEAYGFDIMNSFSIDFKLNYFNEELISPIVVTCNVKHFDDSAYSVYHIKDNGDVIKCKSSWSNNYVSFICEESGKYVILRRDSNNNYAIEDKYENINQYNNSVDNHRFIRQVLAFLVLITLNLISFIVYFIVLQIKEKTWKDYRRSLLVVDSVLEEKQKN